MGGVRMSAIDYYSIGQRIRKYRRLNGLSQEELAERIDISTTHMSHIETANTKLSLPVLNDIAEALGISVAILMGKDTNGSIVGIINEIESIINDCTPQQARVIADIVRTSKQSIDINLKQS